jgi:uncharacterized membrane protein
MRPIPTILPLYTALLAIMFVVLSIRTIRQRRKLKIGLGNESNHIKFFFLLCVLVAGVYGMATSSKSILYIQAIPALIGLALLYLAIN